MAMVFARGWSYIAIVFLISFCYNGPAGIFPAMTTDSFGTKHGGSNWGLVFIFLGASSLTFTKLATVLSSDGLATGDFTASFLTAGVLCIIPLVLLPVYSRRYKKRLAREAEEAAQ